MTIETWIIIVVIVLVAILVFYLVIYKQEQQEEVKQEKDYDEAPPDYKTPKTDQLLRKLSKPKNNNDPIKQYKLGVILYNNYHDPVSSYRAFMKSLHLFHKNRFNGQISLPVQRYYVEKIGSYLKLIKRKYDADPKILQAAQAKVDNVLHDVSDIEIKVTQTTLRPLADNVVNNFLTQEEREMDRIIRNIAEYERKARQKETGKKEVDAETKPAQYIEQKIRWVSDHQNVHDEAIYKAVSNQYNKIKSYNTLYNSSPYTIGSFEEFIRSSDNHKAREVFNWINGVNAKVEEGVTEKDVIEQVWKRIHAPENAEKQKLMKEALLERLANINQDGNNVCISGRVPNILSALHTLDKDETLGVMKTKQALRNEVLTKTAQVTDVELKKMSEDDLKKYNSNEYNDNVKKTIETIKSKYDEIAKEYEPHMPKTELNTLIDECKETL